MTAYIRMYVFVYNVLVRICDFVASYVKFNRSIEMYRLKLIKLDSFESENLCRILSNIFLFDEISQEEFAKVFSNG